EALEEARMEARPTFEAPDAGQPPADRFGASSTDWDIPVVRPFAPQVADGDDEPPKVAQDDPELDIAASRPEPPVSLFEPVAIDVPAEPPVDPRPVPVWSGPVLRRSNR